MSSPHAAAEGRVVGPVCGVGSTLVEAVHQGRDVVGIECEYECEHNWARPAPIRTSPSLSPSLSLSPEPRAPPGWPK